MRITIQHNVPVFLAFQTDREGIYWVGTFFEEEVAKKKAMEGLEPGMGPLVRKTTIEDLANMGTRLDLDH